MVVVQYVTFIYVTQYGLLFVAVFFTFKTVNGGWTPQNIWR